MSFWQHEFAKCFFKKHKIFVCVTQSQSILLEKMVATRNEVSTMQPVFTPRSKALTVTIAFSLRHKSFPGLQALLDLRLSVDLPWTYPSAQSWFYPFSWALLSLSLAYADTFLSSAFCLFFAGWIPLPPLGLRRKTVRAPGVWVDFLWAPRLSLL
jgi:hypothetical protein